TMYFIGRFVGDGWFSSGDKKYYSEILGIAFHTNDIVGIENYKNFITKLGFSFRIEKNLHSKNVIQITVNNKIYVSFFRSIFPEYKQKAFTKSLPSFFRNLPNNLLKSLLLGLADADGSIENSRECIDT